MNARKERYKVTRPLQNAHFCPISVSGSNFNPRNTQCIPVVKIFVFLELEQKLAFFKGLVTPPAEKPELRFFVFAYWHDARFNSKAGGPMKVYELTQNLTKRGHRVYLFIPKIGYPEQQTTAHVFPVPFIDLPVLRFLSFQVLALSWQSAGLFPFWVDSEKLIILWGEDAFL